MDTRKKILFLITKTNWGGAQQYVYDLATNLPKEAFEAVVAGGGGGILFAKLRDAGIRAISVPGLQRNVGIASEWQAFLHIFRLLKKERPYIVHLNSSKAGALGSLAAFFYRVFQVPSSQFQVQIVFTAHGWGFHEDRRWHARAAIFFVSWFSSLFQDNIIVLDHADLAAAQRFIPRRKLALIPNGIKKGDFYAGPPDASGSDRAAARTFLSQKIGRPIPNGTFLIGAIAELTKNKGLHYLIGALNLIKRRMPCTTHHNTTPLIRTNKRPMGNNIFLCIIGDGEEKETLQRQIDTLGLNDTVFLAGFIPDASRYLVALDIFVLPSLKEGLPYSVMEAMAAGLPVVATRVGGISDLITDTKDGLLTEPKDVKGLAAALIRLMEYPDARSAIAKSARQKIKTRFSFSAMIHSTISLYDHAAPPPQ